MFTDEMSTSQRLTEVFDEARRRPLDFDDSSRIILFSDCHRGDNSWADDFAPNQLLHFHALNYYYEQGYTYIEAGDGDELWENPKFDVIRRAHDHIFWRMRQYHKDGRLHLIWGNHDIERQNPEVVKKHLHSYEDERSGKILPLFDGIEVHEGLVLKHAETGQEIFVVHGHQGSRINDQYWRIGKFSVRYGWSRLQAFGIKDPTRPSQDPRKKRDVERKIIRWIRDNDNQVVICGHTHRPRFAQSGKPNYFNIGSCVHPRAITGIEIANGEMSLVKWWTTPDTNSGQPPKEHGPLYVSRQVLVGPRKLGDITPGS